MCLHTLVLLLSVSGWTSVFSPRQIQGWQDAHRPLQIFGDGRAVLRIVTLTGSGPETATLSLPVCSVRVRPDYPVTLECLLLKKKKSLTPLKARPLHLYFHPPMTTLGSQGASHSVIGLTSVRVMEHVPGVTATINSER